MSSYIPDHHRMLAPQRDYVNRVLDMTSCKPADRAFFAHALVCYALSAHRQQDGVPIPYESYQRGLPGANPFRLNTVLEISGYWQGHCREYRPVDSVLRHYLSIASRLSVHEFLATDVVSFETGRKMNKPPRSRSYDANRNVEPPLVRACIERLTDNGAYFMLDDFEAEYRRIAADFEAQTAPDSRTVGRYVAATSTRDFLLYHRPEPIGEGMWKYTPAWFSVSSGRLHHVGGGLQSAARNLKRAGYSNMDGMKNYDIRRCQIYIAIQLMQQAGIDASPLIEYYECADPKKQYGEALGIPGEVAKRIVIALVMGALLPRSVRGWQSNHSSVLSYLADCAADETQLEQLLKRANAALSPMAKALKKWHLYLLETYIPTHKVKGGRGYLLPNAVGKLLPLYDLRLDDARARWIDVAKIAAHLLQGLEQACIQSQIVEDDGMHAISHEHDGFIINDGSPDMRLWQSITARHGLSGMVLEEKPL